MVACTGIVIVHNQDFRHRTIFSTPESGLTPTTGCQRFAEFGFTRKDLGAYVQLICQNDV